MKYYLKYFLYFSITIITISCGVDDPPPLEEEEEIITEVDLTFTSKSGQVVIGYAIDPDGEGPQNLEITDEIKLSSNTEYALSISLLNTIANENITDEVRDEGDEHQFFFNWTEDLFKSPSGNGNIDNPADPMNYRDTDVNGLPIGIESSWTTGSNKTGTIQVILKHQPGSKTNSSGSGTGDTDIDLSWPITVNQ